MTVPRKHRSILSLQHLRELATNSRLYYLSRMNVIRNHLTNLCNQLPIGTKFLEGYLKPSHYLRNLKILLSNWRPTLTPMVSLPRKPFTSNTSFLMSSCLSIKRSIDPSAWKRQRGCHMVWTECSYYTNTFKERNPHKTNAIFWRRSIWSCRALTKPYCRTLQ